MAAPDTAELRAALVAWREAKAGSAAERAAARMLAFRVSEFLRQLDGGTDD